MVSCGTRVRGSALNWKGEDACPELCAVWERMEMLEMYTRRFSASTAFSSTRWSTTLTAKPNVFGASPVHSAVRLDSTAHTSRRCSRSWGTGLVSDTEPAYVKAEAKAIVADGCGCGVTTDEGGEPAGRVLPDSALNVSTTCVQPVSESAPASARVAAKAAARKGRRDGRVNITCS